MSRLRKYLLQSKKNPIWDHDEWIWIHNGKVVTNYSGHPPILHPQAVKFLLLQTIRNLMVGKKENGMYTPQPENLNLSTLHREMSLQGYTVQSVQACWDQFQSEIADVLFSNDSKITYPMIYGWTGAVIDEMEKSCRQEWPKSPHDGKTKSKQHRMTLEREQNDFLKAELLQTSSKVNDVYQLRIFEILNEIETGSAGFNRSL